MFVRSVPFQNDKAWEENKSVINSEIINYANATDRRELETKYIAEEIANLRGMKIEEIIDITTRNAEEFFNI